MEEFEDEEASDLFVEQIVKFRFGLLLLLTTKFT